MLLKKDFLNPIYSIWIENDKIPEQYLYYMNTIASIAAKSGIPYVIYTHTPCSMYRAILAKKDEFKALENYAAIRSLSELDALYDEFNKYAIKKLLDNSSTNFYNNPFIFDVNNQTKEISNANKKKTFEVGLKKVKNLSAQEIDIFYQGKQDSILKNLTFHKNTRNQILALLSGPEVLRYGIKIYAFLSDIYRVLAAYKHGGTYFDVDVKTPDHLLREEITLFFDQGISQEGYFYHLKCIAELLVGMSSLLYKHTKYEKQLQNKLKKHIECIYKFDANIKRLQSACKTVVSLLGCLDANLSTITSPKISDFLNCYEVLANKFYNSNAIKLYNSSRRVVDQLNLIKSIKIPSSLKQIYLKEQQKLSSIRPERIMRMLACADGTLLANGMLCGHSPHRADLSPYKKELFSIIVNGLYDRALLSSLASNTYVKFKTKRNGSNKPSGPLLFININQIKNTFSTKELEKITSILNKSIGSILQNARSGKDTIIVIEKDENQFTFTTRNARHLFSSQFSPCGRLVRSTIVAPIDSQETLIKNSTGKTERSQFPLGKNTFFFPTYGQEHDKFHWTKASTNLSSISTLEVKSKPW